ncbi:hypothetical protein QBC33DRAFT_216050 [Phialemonium atrogriseum]|uniref:Uncharacterized protein n=1 Tax=Phialemonium atrogriseum TaxID=1093897 RepID=A0AAJ0C8U5_9PEZI|nr:uncharacterized protein QBC33DRAFT_216050 [Phialemonium atrogriseum]KAK1770779.1 hypothetical protein QBC33DRAFT_216050 [Phialemonium atrogriseum]
MPALQLPPDSSVTSKPGSSHQQSLLFHPHIYVALAVLAVVLVLRFIFRRLPKSFCLWSDRSVQFRARQPGSSKDSGSCDWDSSAPASATVISRSSLPFQAPIFEKEAQTVWAAGLLDPPASPARIGFVAVPGMGGQLKDQSRSRGVSTGATDSRQQPPPLSAHGLRPERRISRSPRASRAPSSSRTRSTCSDGPSDGRGSAMADDSRPGLLQPGSMSGDGVLEQHFGGDNTGLAAAAAGGSGLDLDRAAPRQFSRPPPPPPLTPPTLSTAMFAFEDRRPHYAVSIPPQLDTSFIHQPNPDYIASSTSAELSSSPTSVVTTPRRRSYTKTVPIGIPISSGSASSPRSQDSSASSEPFSPSSYPPTSPRLPPPPPSLFDDFRYEHDGQPQEIDLQGEIISVMDDAGHGWKRHTRVYGGGVCLACMAAGGQGGFYGDKVPPEERR